MDQGKIIEINTPRNFIQELLDRGFSKPQIKLQANLEDVFLDLTGREWRD
jgi:ABC-2 type transport system ATP-binding protein